MDERHLPWQGLRWPPGMRAGDLVLASAAVGFDVAFFWGDPQDGVTWTLWDLSHPWQAMMGLLALPVLTVRRLAPFAVCVTLSAYAAAQAIALGSRPTLSLLVALYTAAATGTAKRAYLSLGAVLTTHVVSIAYEWSVLAGERGRALAIFATALALLLLNLGAWGFGRRSAAARHRVAQLEVDREELAAQAVADERLRIARELHDIVAHSVTVMLLQAAGARRLVDREPVLAREAMHAVEEAGKQAMAEMHRLLLVLRSVHGPSPQDPSVPDESGSISTDQSRLSDLGALMEQIEAAGVRAFLDVEGTPRLLDPSVDLTAYRVIQEALTNVGRHAGPGSHARIVLSWVAEALLIEVVDDGAGKPSPLTSTSRHGYGLIGLEERVKLMGGTFSAAAVPGSGYRVRVELPLRSVPRSPAGYPAQRID